VPTSVEVAWVFGGRETPYARFQIRRLEYNVEQRFAAR
jgi:hypothetical protein